MNCSRHRTVPILVLWALAICCTVVVPVDAAARRPWVVAGVSSSSHPCPLGGETELWVLAGQSNMEGRGARRFPFTPNPRIMMFNLDNRWMVAEQPIHRRVEGVSRYHRNYYRQLIDLGRLTPAEQERMLSDSRRGLIGGVGPGEYFAEHLIAHIDHPIGLIPCAFGGTSMAAWDPKLKEEGDASLYGAMLERIRMVGGGIRGILWYQGEAETYNWETVEAYEDSFLDFIDSVREDTGISDLPFLFVQLGRYTMPDPELAPAWERIRELQRNVAAQRDNVWMVSAVDLPLDDVIHIGAEGQQRLGRRLAEVALSQVYGLPHHAKPITLSTVEVTGNARFPKIRVRYSGVSGRLTALGRPSGFLLRSDEPPTTAPTVFRADFDPDDPAAVILSVFNPIPAPVRLVYGPGLDPYANIVDERDMPIPAFGPLLAAPSSQPQPD
jgi:hypothetical protein